jgi:hypothetical protein
MPDKNAIILSLKRPKATLLNRSEAHCAFKFSYRDRIKWHGCCVGLYPYVNIEWKNAVTKMSRPERVGEKRSDGFQWEVAQMHCYTATFGMLEFATL